MSYKRIELKDDGNSVFSYYLMFSLSAVFIVVAKAIMRGKKAIIRRAL